MELEMFGWDIKIHLSYHIDLHLKCLSFKSDTVDTNFLIETALKNPQNVVINRAAKCQRNNGFQQRMKLGFCFLNFFFRICKSESYI